MRLGSRQAFSSAERGFTLLELTIAMTFVAVLASGITLSISTCLNVWRRSQETAELNQEARAIIEVLARDIRGAYLGLRRNGGYFLGGVSTDQSDSNGLIEFSTESSSITRAALLPQEGRPRKDGSEEDLGPPVTDFVAVRYDLLDPTEGEPGGLCRTAWVAPAAGWVDEAPPDAEAVSVELISEWVVAFRARYFDGYGWVDGWSTAKGNSVLPQAVAIELTLLDAAGNEHVYQSVIPVPAR